MENESEQLKIRINVDIIKWTFTIFFLVGNFFLILFVDENNTWEDWIVTIIWGISANVLAMFTYIMLSIFPRLYYIIDEKGVSFQNRKGKEKFYKSWEDVESITYVYCIIPEGLQVKYVNDIEESYIICVSQKEARDIYKKIARVREIMDAKKE